MSIRNKILPFVALAGIVFAAVVAFRSGRQHVQAMPAAMPAQAPFASYIGGAGLVEASSENIALGTSLGGVVETVFVKAGDAVKTGQPLFAIDSREAGAALAVKAAALDKAKAALDEAKASLQDYRTQFAIVKDVTDHRAVSKDEVEKRRNAEALARAKVESARVAIASAEAELMAAKVDLERLTVRSPLDCQVLQVNVRAGEYAATGSLTTPLMRLGDLDTLHVRVDIDENDAWRFVKGSRAVASVRGNRDLKTDLTFVRLEPYMVAKTSLTGSSTERVDTRVLQAIYSFPRKALDAFVGQQVDVFIETPSRTDSAAAKTGGGA